MMSFPEKCSFVPPKVYGGSLQRASSSAGEMSEKKKEIVYASNNGESDSHLWNAHTFKINM